MNLASYLDSTNLKADASEKEISLLCEDALKFNMAAVCIHPCRLPVAKKLLHGSNVKLCTVIAFPLGADSSDVKLYAARNALENGADELDMVINIAAFKEGNLKLILKEIQSINALKDEYNFSLKVIVETALLSIDELENVSKLVGESGADYIKTSTGFSTRGVSIEDINTINKYKPRELKVKASGGIRSLDFALELIKAGANRLGTSSAVELIKEFEKNN